MSSHKTLADLIRIFIKWKKIILIITLTGVIGSAIVAFLLPKYYKSTAIFYPYNLNGLDPKTASSNQPTQIFGTNDDIERIIQIAGSSELVNHIIQKYDLYKRYDIDTTKVEYGKYKIVLEFEENVDVIKNEKGAVEVIVLDKDPIIASSMANEIVAKIDQINRSALIDNNIKSYTIVAASLESKTKELESFSNALKGYSEQEKGTTNTALNETEKINKIDFKLTEQIIQLIDLKEKYDRFSLFLKSDFSSIFIIEKAYPIEKKSKPIISLIIIISTLIIFIFTLLTILLIEFYRQNIRELLKNE
jgi:uncharacterized protein involved in exopolysaccharide biosynthesis